MNEEQLDWVEQSEESLIEMEAAAYQQYTDNAQQCERLQWEFITSFNEMCGEVQLLPCATTGSVLTPAQLREYLLFVMQEAYRNNWNPAQLLMEKLNENR